MRLSSRYILQRMPVKKRITMVGLFAVVVAGALATGALQ